jgi:hypothetical protein
MAETPTCPLNGVYRLVGTPQSALMVAPVMLTRLHTIPMFALAESGDCVLGSIARR